MLNKHLFPVLVPEISRPGFSMLQHYLSPNGFDFGGPSDFYFSACQEFINTEIILSVISYYFPDGRGLKITVNDGHFGH